MWCLDPREKMTPLSQDIIAFSQKTVIIDRQMYDVSHVDRAYPGYPNEVNTFVPGPGTL